MTDDSLETLLAHAAVGGLRALSVHERRGQELDSDAIRDRLPTVYAATNAGAQDSLALRGLALAGASAPLAAEVRFLQSSGSRHEAAERRVVFEARPLAELARAPREQAFSEGDLRAIVRLSAEDLGAGRYAVDLQVENATRVHDPRREPRRSARSEPALDAAVHATRRRALRLSARRGRGAAQREHASRCSRPRTTTSCSAPPSCSPSTRRSLPRVGVTSSTARRSRRRCCCTCSRSPTTSAPPSSATIPRCGP